MLRFESQLRRVLALMALTLSSSCLLWAGAPKKSAGPEMHMAMPLVAPLFIEDQDHESVLRMVNELKATVHATVVAKTPAGSMIAQQVVTFPGHTQQVLNVRDLLRSAGLDQAVGSIEVVPNPMEVTTMAIAAQLSITNNRQSPPTYLEEELESPDPGMPSGYRVVVPSALGSPVVALLSTSTMSQTVNVTCLEPGGASTRKAVELRPGHLVLARACSGPGEPISADAAAAIKSVETASGAGKQEAFAIEASSAGVFAVWGIAPVGSRETETTIALNFTESGMMKSPSMVFAGVPVGTTDLLGGEAFRPEMAVANFGPKPAHVSVSYSSTTAGEPQARNAATLLVGPRVVETLHLPELNGDPGMRNSFVVRSDAAPGQVISNLISRGQQMYPAVQLIGKDAQ